MISIYLDEHIPATIARGLKRRGIDVLTTQDAGLSGSSDLEQLAFCKKFERVIVTFDSDYLILVEQGVEHNGVFYCAANKYSTGELITALRIACEVLPKEEMFNHIEFL